MPNLKSAKKDLRRTGGWTGSLIAALLKMDFKKAILACFVGVLLATVIVSFLSYGLLARVVA